MALPISCWVMRLVEPEVATARKANGREETPSFVADGAACDPLLGKTGHLRPQVVAHEIELMPSVALGGMTGELRGRRGKDQPTTAGVDGGKDSASDSAADSDSDSDSDSGTDAPAD